MSTTQSKILRLPEVMVITGLSRSSIYAFMKDDLFPKPINLGARAVGWLADDIEEWIQNRINTLAS